jgi:hypothetical protein
MQEWLRDKSGSFIKWYLQNTSLNINRRLRDAGLLGRVAKKSHISDWLIKIKD